MAEKYELDRWAAVVCNGFTAVNVMSSGNVEELGWDYTEMELDPTGTCGLFDGMLLDWDDDTPAERRDHEAYFPDAFTVGARILADAMSIDGSPFLLGRAVFVAGQGG